MISGASQNYATTYTTVATFTGSNVAGATYNPIVTVPASSPAPGRIASAAAVLSSGAGVMVWRER